MFSLKSWMRRWLKPSATHRSVRKPARSRLGLEALEDRVVPSLGVSYLFNGTGNWSIDGVGSNNTPVGSIDAVVPAGSTVEKAFLYSSMYTTGVTPQVQLDDTVYSGDSWTDLGTDTFLEAYRADVTDQVRAKVGSGGGTYSFEVNSEGPNNFTTDGEALVVIYSNPAEKERTIAILDGASASSGDQSVFNFASPLSDPNAPDFEATMSLGIGFSYDQGSGGQVSQVDVNGQRLTSSAGGSDDGIPADGGLITIGGLGDSTANPPDPFSAGDASQPRYDDELYDLHSFLHAGDTTFQVNTLNPSHDDNIFFEGLNITAKGTVLTHAPTAVDDTYTVNQGGTLTADPAHSVLANDGDLDNDPLTAKLVTSTAHGALAFNADGTFTYTPNPSFSGTDSFTYRANDGTHDSNIATATITVTSGLQDQTISFAPLPDKTYGDSPFAISATASSGLPVSFSIVSGPATYDSTTGKVTLTGAGAVKIEASQAGDSTYNAATPVDQTFNVAKATPTVTVAGGNFTYDGLEHAATGSIAGVNGDDLGTPTFSYSHTDASGNVVTTTSPPVGPGLYTVTASFAGDDNYESGSATATITISFGAQSLTDLKGPFHAGRTIPIKIQLTDAAGNNVSSSSIDVTAFRLEQVNADGTTTPATVQDSGNANPHNLFRYDASLGGYIFNLSTKGLKAGSYNFYWKAGTDPTEHELSFTLI